VTLSKFSNTKTITVNAGADIAGQFNYDLTSTQAVLTASQQFVIDSHGLLSTASGAITLNVPSLQNLGNISASGGGISVVGASGLQVTGGGTYTSSGGTSFTATTGNLQMSSSLNIAGAVTLTTLAAAGQVKIDPSVLLQSGTLFKVITANLAN